MASENVFHSFDVFSLSHEHLIPSEENFLTLDFTGRILNSSTSLLEILGYQPKNWLGKNIEEFIDSHSRTTIHTALDRCKLGNIITSISLPFVNKEGSLTVFSADMVPFFMENFVVFFLRRMETEETPNSSVEKLELRDTFQHIFRHFPMGFVITNDKGYILEVNEFAKKVFEISPWTKVSKTLNHKNWKLLNQEGKGILPREFRLYKAMRKKESIHGLEFGLLKEDGTEFWLEVIASPIQLDGYGMAIVFYDITEKKKKELQSFSLANYDQVTGLPRRKIFLENLLILLEEAIRHNHKIAVIAVDIDNFKYLNESFGHSFGDLLLQEVSKLIQNSIRNFDILSREGGDEFLIALPDIDNEKEAAIVCEAIQDALSKPVPIGNFSAFTSVSMGIAIYPGDGKDPNSLIKNADNALHQAKKKGKNNYSFYKPEMEESVKKRLETELDLRKALNEKEFTIYYQPKIQSGSHELIGAEALIRWLHPLKGMIPPLEFIPLAEETGIILPLGEWILESCSNTWLQWKSQLPQNFRLSINLSAKQLLHEKFLPNLIHLVSKYNGMEKILEFEITESCFMENMETVSKILLEVHKIGIQISIDDFGTGYSSLSYLKKFPFSNLKIDKSFIQDIDSSLDSKSIVQAVIQLGHNLGLKVVAEGVETITHCRILEDMGIDALQGYYFSRPISVFDFVEKFLVAKSS